MGVQVAVAGASGYAGGELLRLLSCHPGMALGPVTAGSNAGEPVTALHPNLSNWPAAGSNLLIHNGWRRRTWSSSRSRTGTPRRWPRSSPHMSRSSISVPTSASLTRAAWQRFYGGQHAGRWTYGLPELPHARARITGSTQVAVPGCFATAAILALAPLLASGLAEPSDIVIVAASGTSGAGRTPKPHLLGAEVMGAMSAYQVGGAHRHIPEIEQALAEAVAAARPAARRGAGPAGQPGAAGKVTVSFTPSLAPMPRGILATCTARLTPRASAAAGGRLQPSSEPGDRALRAALCDAYADEPFVHVLPEGSWPSTAATAGSNAAHLQVAADTRAGRAVVVAAIDNLGKGAAGQAIQNANLMTSLAETAGLTAHGVSP